MKKSFKMLIVCAVIGLTAHSVQAQIGISVRIGPPPLPVYVQPPCPVDGYLWQPGYWAYDRNDGYYWVPGEWVSPPDPGLLWTPAWWGWDNGVYLFHTGYWGPHVGFYGGINYGFGYPGSGFYGGVWSGRSFRYNTAVFNVNRTVIHNTYINRSMPGGGGSRVSFNGGRGGINRQPNATERHFASEHHVAATHTQMEHQQAAVHNPGQRFNANHGRPATAVNRGEAHAQNQPAHAPNIAPHGGAMPHRAPTAPNHEMHGNNAPRQNHENGGRPAMENHPQASHQPNEARANREMNNAPRAQQPHANQPEQHANRMPSQPQQHMGPPAGGQQHMGGGGARPMGGPPAGGMPHGGGGPPAGGGHPMGGGGQPHGGGGPPGGGGGHPGGHHP